ncbi:hypothetical protein [Niveibacterium terrae]|uniref:hypothetical protein n=1 Tax=Niveibacterium terrae TaxID=3373598 RepID=UPI003A95115D
MTRSTLLAATLLASLIAFPVLAQQSQGMGRGMMGGGGWRCGSDNVAGWKMMTPEERTEHRNKMRSMKSYDECVAYQGEHHKLMEGRAKEKGVSLPAPRANACDQMKARGFFK